MSWNLSAAGRGSVVLAALETQAKVAHSYAGEPGKTVIEAHLLAVRAIVAVHPEHALSVTSSGHIDSHSVNAVLDIKRLPLVE